jgi:hypothetical protein
MGAFVENVGHVIALRGEGSDHRLVLEVPIAFGIVGIAIVVEGVLQENADGLFVALLNQFGINMTTLDIRKTADATDDLAEFVRPFPGNVEGANRATAGAANGPAFGALGKVMGPSNLPFGTPACGRESGPSG